MSDSFVGLLIILENAWSKIKKNAKFCKLFHLFSQIFSVCLNMSVTHLICEIFELSCDTGSVYLSSDAGGHNAFTFTDSYFFIN
jgi:hypothetical protein